MRAEGAARAHSGARGPGSLRAGRTLRVAPLPLPTSQHLPLLAGTAACWRVGEEPPAGADRGKVRASEDWGASVALRDPVSVISGYGTPLLGARARHLVRTTRRTAGDPHPGPWSRARLARAA